MTIAVTGATGQLGRLVVEKLKTRADAGSIVALARAPERATDLGVAVRAADYARPETLGPALAGVDVLLLISSSEVGVRVEQHHNVIEAAKRAGVRRLAYTSLLHAATTPLSLGEDHRATEAELAQAGLPYTVLRDGWYGENYVGPIQGALASGALVGSAGDGRISAAPRADYAEAAAVVLTSEGHAGKVYELAADSAWTLTDLAAEISRQTGRDIPYRNLPQAEYAAILRSAGVAPPFADFIAAFDVGASQGALFDESRQLSALIGRPTGSLSEIVAAALK